MSWRASILVVLAALACLAMFWQGRTVAELAGREQAAARNAEAAKAAAEQRTAAAEQRAASLEERNRELAAQVARLERDLEGALASGRAIGEAVAAQIEALQRAQVARESTAALATVPVPSGVARCLTTLRDCLVADSFHGLRFLAAREVADLELRDVELLDSESGRGTSELIVAARMTAVLDRTKGTLVLTFYGGTRRALGLRVDLPEAGYEKRFQPVTGPMFEEKLPYLVRAIGAYPVVADEPQAPAATLDPLARRAWIERVDALLGKARTDLRLRLASFRDLRGGSFRTAQLAGYDQDKRLGMTADCNELAIEVDARAGVVSLLLRDGTLRGPGGDSTIGKDGYRMLLTDITPKVASDAMLGMVVQR
jgi:hypothetical protein